MEWIENWIRSERLIIYHDGYNWKQLRIRKLYYNQSNLSSNSVIMISGATSVELVVRFVVARYIIVIVALATAISLLAQQISSIRTTFGRRKLSHHSRL